MSISIGAAGSYMDSLKEQATSNIASKNATKINSSVNNLSKDSTTEELESAVKSFEQYFVEQMLKEMEKTAKVFSSEDSDDALTDYYMDFAISEVAKQMVEDYGGRVTEDFVKQLKINYGIDPSAFEGTDSV